MTMSLVLPVHEAFEEAVRLKKVSVSSLSTAHMKPTSQKTQTILDIYCHEKEQKQRISRIWRSITLRLHINDSQYVLYRGPNASAVWRQWEEASQSWLNLMPWKTNTVSLALFNDTCIGVDTRAKYRIQLVIKPVDPQILACFIAGIVLFFTAERLSRNVMFYYGTGVSVGLLASLLIVVFVLSRFIPKRYGAYVVLIGGWSVALWALQYAWENIYSIVESYSYYVLGYFATAGLVSFGVCYYKGPVTDPRSLSLIKWTLQLCALALVYFGTQLTVVSVATIILIVTISNFPSNCFQSLHIYWRRRFPPKLRHLTEDEYIMQGCAETRRALSELKEYCHSPECDTWRTVSRLKSPHRFAEWVEGSSPHVSDDEIRKHERNAQPPLPQDFTDDESDDDFSWT